MAIKPHPDYDKMRRAFAKFAGKGLPFNGVCYRCTEIQFASGMVTGTGSRIHGGRWNPKNSFAAVYLCDSTEAALQEFLARGRRMRIADHKSLPMVMAGVKVKVSKLLDLREAEVKMVVNSFLHREGIHWRAIQDRREAASQALGRALRNVCFSGLIAESQALPGGRNIVIFPNKLSDTESLAAPELKQLL